MKVWTRVWCLHFSDSQCTECSSVYISGWKKSRFGVWVCRFKGFFGGFSEDRTQNYDFGRTPTILPVTSYL